MSVTKYNFEVASQFKITDQIVYVEARPSKNGKYVRYSDYAALRNRVARLEDALRFILDECDWEESMQHACGDNRIGTAARRALEEK